MSDNATLAARQIEWKDIYRRFADPGERERAMAYIISTEYEAEECELAIHRAEHKRLTQKIVRRTAFLRAFPRVAMVLSVLRMLVRWVMRKKD